jgi:hypothetical protein
MKDLNLPPGYFFRARAMGGGRGAWKDWAQIISQAIARWFAKEEGMGLSSTLERKLTNKILDPITWHMWGVPVKYLREWDAIQDIWQGFKKDEDLKVAEKAEKNIIPLGENYHRDVGWY